MGHIRGFGGLSWVYFGPHQGVRRPILGQIRRFGGLIFGQFKGSEAYFWPDQGVRRAIFGQIRGFRGLFWAYSVNQGIRSISEAFCGPFRASPEGGPEPIQGLSRGAEAHFGPIQGGKNPSWGIFRGSKGLSRGPRPTLGISRGREPFLLLRKYSQTVNIF